MPLAPGTRLGHYEIASLIGAGGMGEVYKAKDSRLNRAVAIKTLPQHLSGNSELRERFEREARTISSLNHPHICTLHDIGQQDGIDYIVMEYIDGAKLLDFVEAGIPHVLFDVTGHTPGNTRYVATPDGQRFLFPLGATSPDATALTVVLNWTAGVKQ